MTRRESFDWSRRRGPIHDTRRGVSASGISWSLANWPCEKVYRITRFFTKIQNWRQLSRSVPLIPISKMFVTEISQNIGDKLVKSNADSTPSRRESTPDPILLSTSTRDRERIGKIFVIFFLLATVDIELTSEYFRD